MRVLIPNATSPKNVGDLAMLVSLVNFFKEKDEVIIHSTESQLYKKHLKRRAFPTLYSWAVFENPRLLTRIGRMFNLLSGYILFKSPNLSQRKNQLIKLINDYKKADLIVFAGGGYLRSQKGISQSLNLLMNLFLFSISKKTNARKIVAPISVGPFAYKWQERLAAKVLNGLDVVSVREKYSYKLLKKYQVSNLMLSSDMALFLSLNKDIEKKKHKKFILGFTIRKWLSPIKQKEFEENFAKAIINFSRAHRVIVQPIVQVDAPKYGDVDFELTEQIAKYLREAGVEVRPIKKVTDLNGTASIYKEIDLLLGMRMHSNILAAVQGTPFVAIAYEYKTEGIAKDLGLEDFCIKVEKANNKNILRKLNVAFKTKNVLKSKIEKSLKKIKSQEKRRWVRILEN